LELSSVIREGIEGLEHEDLEHQHRIVELPPLSRSDCCSALRKEARKISKSISRESRTKGSPMGKSA
jgi:hypothetical protein